MSDSYAGGPNWERQTVDCKCYTAQLDRDTEYAAAVTGCDTRPWTVTEDCPIHRKQPQAASGGTLSDIIAWAKTKTPCASNYECLLADLIGFEAAQKVRPRYRIRILGDDYNMKMQHARREVLEEAARFLEHRGNDRKSGGQELLAQSCFDLAQGIRSLAETKETA